MSDLPANEACDRALQRLYEFHDHALTEAEADEIREHLLACDPAWIATASSRRCGC